MVITINELDITNLLRAKIDAHIKQIIENEIKAAKENLVKQISQEADKMALDVLSYYSIERDNQNIIITVKKPQL